jgi:hypothetical protein
MLGCNEPWLQNPRHVVLACALALLRPGWLEEFGGALILSLAWCFASSPRMR